MWQVFLAAAAAAAGSGILAKKLIINTSVAEPSIDFKPDHQKNHVLNDQESFNESLLLPQDSIFSSNDGLQDDYNDDAQCEVLADGSIFRFSSTPGPSCSVMGSTNLRKKLGCGSRRVKENAEGLGRNAKGKEGKKCEVVGCGKQGWVVEKRSGKRFSVCLKKRRTSKNITGKCESCASKGNSFFNWGLSIGMMYMMSAGKAEFSRLNNSMDETAKLVKELKAELSRRKTLHNRYSSNLRTEVETNQINCRGMLAYATATTSCSEKADAGKVIDSLVAEEGECSSSVLTEEQPPDLSEMDHLEAEFESELQKLPWCFTEGSRLNERADTSEAHVLARELHRADDKIHQIRASPEFDGISPSELDQKLSHLLIEQQESQIVQLESELHQTHSKLYEKEAELQALKDCVRRLTDFSLGSASDEGTEVQTKDDKTRQGDQEMKPGPESSAKSIVGMKRAMDFE
ncbi:uncharacterized protein [Coffea arabica]|uniref:Protein POLAR LOCALIZATION DURING ASYMMETRIC DIVISION AND REDISTRIBUTION-like n=1 Tax=Coffea arabica TaxID=13443 RepID=A0A6P6T4J3_COFAR